VGFTVLFSSESENTSHVYSYDLLRAGRGTWDNPHAVGDELIQQGIAKVHPLDRKLNGVSGGAIDAQKGQLMLTVSEFSMLELDNLNANAAPTPVPSTSDSIDQKRLLVLDLNSTVQVTVRGIVYCMVTWHTLYFRAFTLLQ
jgi:hypothetical protein